MKSIHHYEVGMGIDGLQCARHRLIEKFLAIVEIALNEVVHAVFIAEGGERGLGCNLCGALAKTEREPVSQIVPPSAASDISSGEP